MDGLTSDPGMYNRLVPNLHSELFAKFVLILAHQCYDIVIEPLEDDIDERTRT